MKRFSHQKLHKIIKIMKLKNNQKIKIIRWSRINWNQNKITHNLKIKIFKRKIKRLNNLN